MATNNNSCTPLQQSLGWCDGKPQVPGIKKRLYYITKSAIAKWPTLQKDENGRPTSAVLNGSFVLVSGQYWHYIDTIAKNDQVTSEAQGEYPSQTQLNKLVAVHPGVDEAGSAASAYLNNSDNVFIVETMDGKYRVVGSEMYETVTTVSQDLGQGATGTAGTTINAEATDLVPAPFYTGEIALSETDVINQAASA